MKRITTPFIHKLGEEIIEFLFTNIADNIEMTDDENVGKSVQEFLIGMKNKINELESNLMDVASSVTNLEEGAFKGKPWVKDIVDDLDSNESDKSLSALQGKKLKEMIGGIKASSYYTDLNPDSQEFVDFVNSLPEGALVSMPESNSLPDILIKDIDAVSLYLYLYAPIEEDIPEDSKRPLDINALSLYEYNYSPILIRNNTDNDKPIDITSNSLYLYNYSPLIYTSPDTTVGGNLNINCDCCCISNPTPKK